MPNFTPERFTIGESSLDGYHRTSNPETLFTEIDKSSRKFFEEFEERFNPELKGIHKCEPRSSKAKEYTLKNADSLIIYESSRPISSIIFNALDDLTRLLNGQEKRPNYFVEFKSAEGYEWARGFTGNPNEIDKWIRNEYGNMLHNAL